MSFFLPFPSKNEYLEDFKKNPKFKENSEKNSKVPVKQDETKVDPQNRLTFLIECISDILFVLTCSRNKNLLGDYILTFHDIDQLITIGNFKGTLKVYFENRLDVNEICELLDINDDTNAFCSAYGWFFHTLNEMLFE